jgi:hypothetical protein
MMQAEIDDRLPGTVLRFSRKRPFRVGVLYKRQAMALMMLPIKDPLELLDAVELAALEPLWWWPWCLTSVGDLAWACAVLCTACCAMVLLLDEMGEIDMSFSWYLG